MVDKYIHQKKMYPGGNALNFSVYAKQLGAKASYLGVVGNDPMAEHIVRVLKEMDIDVSRLRYQEGENAYTLVNLVEGDRVFVGHNDGGVRKLLPIVLDKDLDYLKGFDHIHTSVYSELDKELDKLQQIAVPVSFDFSNEWNRNYLDQICPFIDYAILSCGDLAESSVKETLDYIASLNSNLLAVATMESKGSLSSYKGRFYYQEPELVEVTDTLGAGDAFFTAFIMHLLEKSPGGGIDEAAIEESLQAGASFAAKTCLIEGAFGCGLEY